MQPFEKSYRLLSPVATVALPVAMLGMNLIAFLLVNCFEPVMDLSCDRATATCRVEEHTWLSRKGPTELALETTRFETERRAKQTLLRIRSVDGSTAFDTGLTNASARTVKKKVDAFVTDPSARTLSLHEGFPTWVVLCFLPIVIGIAGAAMWGLGGRFLVQATAGRLSVTRVRWLWRKENVLAFPPHEVPSIEAKRFKQYKSRNQGVLTARASTGEVEFARAVPLSVIENVRDDLVLYFGAR